MSAYRDDVDAARARIAQLEEEVADLRAQLRQTPATQARLVELQGRRSAALESVQRVEQGTRRGLAIAFLLTFGCAVFFVAVIASLGSQGHPINAGILSVILMMPVLGLIATVGRMRRHTHAREVDAVDREIASVLNARLEIRVAAPPVRVALEDGEIELVNEPPPQAERRGRA